VSTPRIPPGGRRDIGLANWLFAQAAKRTIGTTTANIFTTLGRHRGLLKRFLIYNAGMMPGGKLGRQETELVILRVAHLCDSPYERDHHVRIGRRVGLTAEQIARVADGPDADGWTAHQAALLRATDELTRDHRISDATWDALRPDLDDRQLIELCLLAGHYTALAGTLNSLGVQLDTRK
jgi:alkylhydroperoxidase family enzyme